MVSLNFTHEGRQHFIRILRVDEKPENIAVYEGLLDGNEYFYWESQLNEDGSLAEWHLFADALQAYMAHEKDDTVVKTRWRDG